MTRPHTTGRIRTSRRLALPLSVSRTIFPLQIRPHFYVRGWTSRSGVGLGSWTPTPGAEYAGRSGQFPSPHFRRVASHFDDTPKCSSSHVLCGRQSDEYRSSMAARGGPDRPNPRCCTGRHSGRALARKGGGIGRLLECLLPSSSQKIRHSAACAPQRRTLQAPTATPLR